jgi:hypothetical protein
MQNLKKLIQLIGYKGNKYIALFEKQLIKPGKEQSLFQGIINSSFKMTIVQQKFYINLCQKIPDLIY